MNRQGINWGEITIIFLKLQFTRVSHKNKNKKTVKSSILHVPNIAKVKNNEQTQKIQNAMDTWWHRKAGVRGSQCLSPRRVIIWLERQSVLTALSVPLIPAGPDAHTPLSSSLSSPLSTSLFPRHGDKTWRKTYPLVWVISWHLLSSLASVSLRCNTMFAVSEEGSGRVCACWIYHALFNKLIHSWDCLLSVVTVWWWVIL